VKNAVLITSHYLGSRRRAGFHFIADALRRGGWHVTFMTVGFSEVSRLKREHRFDYRADREAGRLITLAPGLDSYVWFTPFHPVNRLPAPIAWAATPVFARYGSLPLPNANGFIREADLFVFESTAGLMLVDRFRALNPQARLVYRVSDDLRALRAHSVVRDAEQRVLPQFDLVSVPSQAIFDILSPLSPKVRLQHHGIDKAAFDVPGPSPYGERNTTNAVFVGIANLDREFLAVAAELHPGWRFHVFGPFAAMGPPNIVSHGELPFGDTVPFIVHADVGLAAVTRIPNAEVLSDSLKVIQFTYARLPFVVPDFIRSARQNAIPYVPGDRQSIRGALEQAATFDRSTISRDGILSWDELAAALAGDLVI